MRYFLIYKPIMPEATRTMVVLSADSPVDAINQFLKLRGYREDEVQFIAVYGYHQRYYTNDKWIGGNLLNKIDKNTLKFRKK